MGIVRSERSVRDRPGGGEERKDVLILQGAVWVRQVFLKLNTTPSLTKVMWLCAFVCVPAFKTRLETDVLVRQTGKADHHWKELRRAQKLIQHTFRAKDLTGAQHA